MTARGIPCDVIDRGWLAEPEAMAVSVASHVAAGKVKIAAPAYEKSRTVPLSGALVFHGGRVADDPLRLAWLVGVRLAMGD